MEDNKPLLSLCIPTNGRVEWILPVIESIYAQGVDPSLYEVVVTDNGEGTELETEVNRLNYNNFHYIRTQARGFSNQIDAFENCSGVFCKMLNHRSRMMPGSIEGLLNFIRKYQDTKPILYCAEGHAKGGLFVECANTDEFVRKLGLYCSWSAGTGAWQKDLVDIRNKKVDSLFPHTLFLFNLREESSYVIWNEDFTIMADDAGKGGYDVFYAFSVQFLDILSALRYSGRVSTETFLAVKKEVYRFVCGLFQDEVVLPTKHSFLIQNIRQSMQVYYGDFHYFWMVIWGYVHGGASVVLSFFRNVFRHEK